MPALPLPPEEIAPLMQFIAEKVKNVKSPISVNRLAAEFKEKSGSLMALRGLRARIEILRQRIHRMDNFDIDAKVKMMFALSASIDEGFLNELKKQAVVEVDEKGRITKYQSKDESLELEGIHGQRYIKRSTYTDRWRKVCQEANDDESEEDDNEDANEQEKRENKRVDLVRFLIERTKNATSPLNLYKLAKDYKIEFKSSESQLCICHQISRFRPRIHDMNQFDEPTKVKMMFALSAPIDAGFLIELKKVADVQVDDQQRIIQYKQKDGGLELSGKHLSVPMKMRESGKYLRLSINQAEQRDREIIQLLAKKSETVVNPMPDEHFLKEFKERTRCTDSLESLRVRYRRVKETIYQSTGIDQNTKIKMMFISNVQLSDDVLEELRKEANVEVDEKGRITKYEANDGSLNLKGSHGLSSIKKSFYSDRWQTICENVNEVDSEKDDEEDANWQKDYEQKRIELVRFLIERTKNATCPLNILQLAFDYKAEYKSSEPPETTVYRIRSFRQRIHGMNQFDISTKVKLIFALSSTIDAKFLKELQKDAIVEVDEKQRIKKYKAKDGSLELEGDHCRYAKVRAVWADKKKRRVVNNSSESEDDGDEENGSESTRSKQTPTSSSARKSDRLRKSRITLQNKNKKRQLPKKSSGATHTRNNARMSRGKKRTRISYSSPETSEDLEESLTLEDDLPESVISQFPASIPKGRKRVRQVSEGEESLKLEDDSEINFNTKNAGDPLNYEENLNDIPEERKPESLIDTNNSDEFDYDPSNYEVDMDHLPIDRKPESLMEVNTEESSTTIVGNHYEENLFQYAMASETNNITNGGDDIDYNPLSYHQDNERNDAEDMDHETTQEVEKGVPKEASTKTDENLEHIGSKPAMDNVPEERKPENLIEVKTEVPDEPPGGENGLIEPKIEEFTREVKQEAEEKEEGTSTSSSVKIESMSLLELLNHLRPPIAQYTPTLVLRIDENIKKLEEKDKQIPFNIVFESLVMCIQLLNTLEEIDSDENTTSLPNFFYRLGTAMCTIKHSMMNDFYLKIKKLACTAEKKVSLEHIRYVMGKTLDRILH